MIRFSVFYPQTEGAAFDHEYYRANHVALCRETWKPTRTEIDKGVDGPNVAAVHFLFESSDDLQAAMDADGTAAIVADAANFTTITPVTQVSETF